MPVQLTASGAVALPVVAALADSTANPTLTAVQVYPMLYGGGGTWDRDAGNLRYNMYTSAPQIVGTMDTGDYTNPNGRYLDVILDVTNANGGTATLTIFAKDISSGKYYPLLVGAGVAANSTVVYRVGPGLTAAANSIANLPVPRIFKVQVAVATATMTFSVGSAVSV